MLELLRLAGSPQKSIRLQTRAGTDVENDQAAPPDERMVRIADALAAKHPFWSRRRPHFGIYNCAGHVWANRRTSVREARWWNVILKDDGYRRIDEREIMPGDAAIYTVPGGTFLHVGLVMELRPFSGSTSGAVVPLILSKWNDSIGEFLHRPKDVPDSFEPY